MDDQFTQRSCDRMTKIFVVTIALICFTVVFYEQNLSYPHFLDAPIRLKSFFGSSSGENDQQLIANRSKLILTWNPFFSYDLAKTFTERGLKNCKYRCTATSNRSQLAAAEVVVFHIRNTSPQDLPQSRSRHQLFAFFLQESPYHTGNVLNYLPRDYFNITMSYRLDSDVHAGYGRLTVIDNLTTSEEVWKWEDVGKIVESKTKSVLSIVSNCNTESKREFYTRVLAKYITVTEFGHCSNRTCDAKCAEEAIAQHHFYLAFENSVCRDYVTEKAFARMEKIIVPVVLKRSIASSLLPNGSFIAADDFDSPASLAAYMRHLEINKTEYLKYFDWTKIYKKKTYEDYACNLCSLLHEKPNKSRIIKDIKKWWFGHNVCINDYAMLLLNN
uniref:Fucosyltransferase n=1 Tax=Ascaris suum TaxID=6253 RepID=F1L3G8_ASCSU